MKRVLSIALAITAILSFATLQSLAKGGGHGGGHGGHHGGHHSHHSHHHSHHGHHSHHHVAHHHHDHHHHHHGGWGWGGGWGGGGYAWGSPWAAPTYGAAATWLGLTAPNNGGGVTVNNNTTEPTANTQPLANTQTEANTNGALAASEESTQPEDAAELAASGVAEPPADAKFMPLGVFSLAPKGKKEATALLHLAVSKDGTLRGTYYDLSTDKHETVVGAVDQEDGMLAWTIGSEGNAVYHAWLEDLTDPPGPVTLKSKDAKTQVFTAARYTEEDEKRDFEQAETKHPKHHKETPVTQ